MSECHDQEHCETLRQAQSMREQSELAFERMCEVKDEAIAIMHSHDAQFAELVRAISSEELVMALAQIQSLQASRHIGKELDRRGITWRK